MGGNNDFLCLNVSLVADGCVSLQRTDGCLLVDLQLPGDMGKKIQRMKLPLAAKSHRADSFQGHRNAAQKIRGISQLFQGTIFQFQFLVPGGIYEGISIFEAAGNGLAQLLIFFHSVQVCVEIQRGQPAPKFFQQLVVQKAVLGCDLGGGVLRNAAADPVGFCQNHIYTCILQHLGAQDPGDPAADHQHIRFPVTLELGKFRQFRRLCP